MFKNHLAIEPLEKRMMLNGTVEGVVVDDVLTLTGDYQDNAIFISEGANAKQFIVQTVDPAAGHDALWLSLTGKNLPANLLKTQIKQGGAVGDFQVFDGVKTIEIELKNGDDVVGIAHSDVLSGAAEPSYMTVKKHVFANLGNGDDQFGIHYADIFGKLKVKTVSGKDFVGLDEAFIARRAVFRTGGGKDEIFLMNAYINGEARIFAGGGDDNCLVTDSWVGGSAHADMSTGVDDLHLYQLQVDKMTTLLTGSETDFVSVSESTFWDSVDAYLGDHDDYMSVDGSFFDSYVTVDGEAGTDTLDDYGTNTYTYAPVVLNIP